MEQERICCPVCTLYLREGITLQAHLETHSKEKLIEALIRVTYPHLLLKTSDSTKESGQSTVGSNSVIQSTTSSLENSQTQVSSAVTYEQYVTTNASSVITPYAQVVAPRSNTSLVPTQAITYMTHPQSSHYAHSIYNSLYNPYIPPQYPLVQPNYTNMTFSSDFNSHVSTSQVKSPGATPSSQIATSPEPIIDVTSVKEESTVVTETGSNVASAVKNSKRGAKRRLRSILSSRLHSRSQSVCRRNTKIRRYSCCRRKITASTSVTSLSSTSAAMFERAPNANSTTNSAAETSVIAKAKSPKLNNKPTSPKELTSSSTSVITQLPVASAATFRRRSSESSSSPDHSPIHSPIHSPVHLPGRSPYHRTSISFLSTAVYESADTDMDSEESNFRPDVLRANNSNVTNLNEYSVNYELARSSTSVIAGGNNVVQLTGDMLIGNNMYENITDSDSQNETSLPQMPFHVGLNTAICDQQADMSENENFERDGFVHERDPLSVYEEEVSDKLPLSYKMEPESKAGNPLELRNQKEDEDEEEDVEEEDDDDEENSVNRDETLKESETSKLVADLLSGPRIEEQAKESEFIDNAAPGSAEGDNTTRVVTKVSSVIFLGNSGGSNQVATSAEAAAAISAETACQLREISYPIITDLEPATGSNSIIENLKIAASLNLHDYMEVDGVKIFFNASEVKPTLPTDHVIKLSTLEAELPKVENLMKPENESETAVESVIQLVSAPTEKAEFSDETFHSSTSESNSEARSISPISLNIRTDESMPAKGELSEQESLGAENSSWSLFHTEVRVEPDILDATVLDIGDCDGKTRPIKCSTWQNVFPPAEAKKEKECDEAKPLNGRKPRVFSCPNCEEKFNSLRDRKDHLIRNHFCDYNKNIKARKEAGRKLKRNLKNSGSASLSDLRIKLKGGVIVKNDPSVKKSANKSACEVTKICPECQLPFVGSKTLKKHLREVHFESKYKCGTCCEIFETEKEFNTHLQIHPLECNDCGSLFNRKANLILHVKRHLSDKPFNCDDCSKSFITRQKLEEHVNGHSGYKPLRCDTCNKTFGRHSNLVQHKKSHHSRNKKKVKDFICRCGEVFQSARKLDWHKEVHDPKPKTCPFCCQKFIHMSSVTRHIRRTHMPHYLPSDKKDATNVQCPVCGKLYLKGSISVHMRVHSGYRPHVCKICTKSFTTKWNLELHNWTHQSRSNMPYKCTSCKSAFYRHIDYSAHMNSHRNVRPFTCNVCGQKFIRKYNCIRHQEEHKEEKRFVCTVPECKKSFHRSYYLRDHMRTHTGVKPFTCHICGKASSTKSNHNKHIRIHDTREPLNTEN